jgi:uncharacterized protein
VSMKMSGEVQLAAPRDTVWQMLNGPEVLKTCIPGCESLAKVSEVEFEAVAVNKVGPVKARFKGKVRFEDIDPPTAIASSAKVTGESPALPRAEPP